jgi:hypothetical protein
MRITIDIDATHGQPAGAPQLSVAASAEASPEMPAELLARARAANAISAGPAPDFSLPLEHAEASAQAASTAEHGALLCGLAPGEFNGITNAGAAPGGAV